MMASRRQGLEEFSSSEVEKLLSSKDVFLSIRRNPSPAPLLGGLVVMAWLLVYSHSTFPTRKIFGLENKTVSVKDFGRTWIGYSKQSTVVLRCTRCVSRTC